MRSWDSFARFLVVGGSATALQYGLLVAGVNLELGPTTLISGGAFLISAVYNFFLTRSFTFRSRVAIGPAALRYATMIGVGLVLNTIVMMTLLQMGLYYVICQMVATLVILSWHYLVAGGWVFREGSNGVAR